jgi:putative peptidoglycan lipid II flippase
MLIPEIAIAQSIAIAALPTFSAQVAKGQLNEMRSSLASLLRAVLLLAVPASLGLILLAKPVVAFIFQRGAFDLNSTELVAWALAWYAAGLVGHSIVEIVSRAFYALHDTKTPVFVGVAAMSLNIALSILISRWFISLGWMPHGGLALANSLATFLESFVLLFFMRRRLSGLDGGRVLNGLWKALAAGGAMTAALWGWVLVTSKSGSWLITLGGIAAGVLVYGLVLIILRTPEISKAIKFLKQKVSPAARKN